MSPSQEVFWIFEDGCGRQQRPDLASPMSGPWSSLPSHGRRVPHHTRRAVTLMGFLVVLTVAVRGWPSPQFPVGLLGRPLIQPQRLSASARRALPSRPPLINGMSRRDRDQADCPPDQHAARGSSYSAPPHFGIQRRGWSSF